MRVIYFPVLITSILLSLNLGGCSPHQEYHPKTEICINASPNPSVECESHSVQKYPDYLLGIIEFDDQGLLFARSQLDALVNNIYEQAIGKDLLMVAFMHGWGHNAAPADQQLQSFRNLLERINALEQQLSTETQEPPRTVIGVYLGWRGESITVPILDNLTFWERNNTARNIGEVGLAEVLGRLERVKFDKESIGQSRSRTRLAIIGHGLGGTAIYSAVAQTLKNRFIQTIAPEGAQGNVAGLGNLVALINPTLSAMQFSPLSDMAAARASYFGSQLPILAVLTSETDYVTKTLFSLGQRVNTVFENERNTRRWNAVSKQIEVLDESLMNRTAIGNFIPYRTHYLHSIDKMPFNTPPNPLESFYKTYSSWVLDYPGSQIELSYGALMVRNEHSAGRNPYLVVQMNRGIISNHDDFSSNKLQEFLKELIMVSCQTPKMIEKNRAAIVIQR